MPIKDFFIERYYAKYEFTTPYMLSSSDAESFTIKEIFDLGGSDALDDFMSLHLSYTESQGDPGLRKEIAKLYSNCKADDILIFTGAEEGIFSFMSQFTQDDNVIVQFPGYQSLYEVARSNGVKVTLWKMKEERSWNPDIEELKNLVVDKTRAIAINTPNNPTGYNYTQEEFQKIIELCRENDIILFSDEVYRLGEYDSRTRLPNAADNYENAISLGVLSKPIGLAGLRIGWIATRNQDWLQKLQSFKDYTTICNSAPSEFLARIAIQNVNVLLKRNMTLFNTNLELLRAFMSKYNHLFTWVEPNAGTIGFVKTLFTEDVEDFCFRLIEEKGVLLLPGTAYEYSNNHFRIGFGRKNFPQSLRLLEDYVIEHLS